MPEHYTNSTVGVLKWCNACGRRTLHAVSGKRAGHCTEHEPSGMSKAQERAAKVREREEREPKLL